MHALENKILNFLKHNVIFPTTRFKQFFILPIIFVYVVAKYTDKEFVYRRLKISDILVRNQKQNYSVYRKYDILRI